MLKTLMGDQEVTRQFKTRTDKLNFVEVKGGAAQHFKRVVRDLEFDVAEMAIITYLIAKAYAKPYRLLPFTVLARYQHPFLVYNAARGTVTPEDLHGKRVGVRSYSVTTGAWIRQILAEDHGVDISRIKWVTYEEAHVAEFRDPPNVERAPAGKEITAMLKAGEIDAAILGAIPTDPQLKPVIRDPEAAGKRWGEKHGAIQLNHLVVVKNTVPQMAADEVFRMLVESKTAAGNPPNLPHGLEATRHDLELAIDCAYKQRLIPQRFTVEQLLR
ncbi:MAG TPA: phosphate ABC transporter substrate-binding protein [Burkholderiales bacterium]|nr:phosphate ABC transporter substrate-binding protein [Burkholderiales bacterium]